MTATGETPTFVLIPGSGATSFMWTPLVRELAQRGHRSFPVELPGHGFETTFPPGYQCPQDADQLATAPSPVAGLTLDDYVGRVLELVRRAAEHGPVVLVGHSMGGSTVTGVANTAPELLARMVYLCAYCCVELPGVPGYAPKPEDPDDVLNRARQVVWIGAPRRTGTSRTNPRAGDPQVLAIQHELMMADLDPAATPAVLNYALQPDESLQVMLADARVDPTTWTGVPRTYIRTTQDRVIPPDLQDCMIAEADALSPANPFDVHSLAASHFAPITRPAEIAEILIATTQP
ncbi:alpha/beta hydrolase [Saccharopolyspora sp. K220]|uniref:alpha/beta fold hydrolase n=1 Tax=Saccharopolyspora soli TaxID=2926618 RepID=UPI001F568B20|nr:alpha/beta fold hydrolase [Saccharopolyspora soli]MCI2417904.1 alpha/beta hydrolase [Saccharopolyspora soli]